MANKTVEANIKCPFYVHQIRNLICCEGMMKNTCMTTQFPSTENKKSHMEKNCFLEDGGQCPMAKSLFEKYGMKSLKEAL